MSDVPVPAPQARSEPGLSPGWIAALIMVPVGMLVLALVLFPRIYSLWCRISGTQLRPNNAAIAAAVGTHTGRFITVHFEGNIDDPVLATKLRFWAEDSHKSIEVGIDNRTIYHFHNLSNQTLRFRPVHYVSPINASTQFGMKVCFCFNDQEMAPGESKEYPVVFTFSPQLDARIHTVSICYELFEKRDGEDDQQLDRRAADEIGKKGAVVSPRRGPDPLPTPPAAPAAVAPRPEAAP